MEIRHNKRLTEPFQFRHQKVPNVPIWSLGTSITRDNFPINAPIVYTGDALSPPELDKKFTRRVNAETKSSNSWFDRFDLYSDVSSSSDQTGCIQTDSNFVIRFRPIIINFVLFDSIVYVKKKKENLHYCNRLEVKIKLISYLCLTIANIFCTC